MERLLKLRERNDRLLKLRHPDLETIWSDLDKDPVTPVNQLEMAPQPPTLSVTLLPFQRRGVTWLKKQEKGRFSGGILADEMGMGKTIQMIALLLSTYDPEKPPGSHKTLIVVPAVALMQWQDELQKRCTSPWKILLYHGTSRSRDPDELEKYDIVLTTYAILEYSWRSENLGRSLKSGHVYEDSALHAINWDRVVLDEAHCIKDRSSQTARATFGLTRRSAWAMTGTPLQNRVGELYSLIRFLHVTPFSYYFCRVCPCTSPHWPFLKSRLHCDECGHRYMTHLCWWNFEILKPITSFGSQGPGLVAFNKLGKLLDHMMLRRTKNNLVEELGLPPRVVRTRYDVFSVQEEELYRSLYSDIQRQYQTYVTQDTVLSQYASIFSLISRMRLAANHPDLVVAQAKRLTQKDTGEHTVVCAICYEPAEDAILSNCKHTYCRVCAQEYIGGCPAGQEAKCPSCFRVLRIDLTAPKFVYSNEKNAKGQNVSGYRPSIVSHINMRTWRSSTKIEALVEELDKLQRDDSTAKSIVFSQFISFLELVQWRLARAGFNVVRLDGCMSPQQRADTINTFMTDPTVTVFLVSLKAGGVALNLTEASRVFVLDPWFNPAVEDQAFDRIHRLGQHRPITITRLIIANSIESRILELQGKKKLLFDSTIGQDLESLSRITRQEMEFLFQS